MVVKQVKQWLQSRASSARWRAVQDWAESRRAEFRADEDGAGFQIDQPKARPGALRIEWGPSQRDYIPGAELRMRCELGLPSELQVMVLDKHLMEELERSVFEAYTDSLKTRVDTDTPEEMRWLVMFSKCLPQISASAREHMGFVGIHKELATDWLESELGELLGQASSTLLKPGRPFVLMCMRGNAYLRVAMDEADAGEIQGLVKLLETAGREAQRLSSRAGELGSWPSTLSAPLQPGKPS